MTILKSTRTAMVTVAALAFTSWAASADDHVLLGDKVNLGNGTVQTYVELQPSGIPRALGVSFTSEMLDNLPVTSNLVDRCFDANANGAFEASECEGDFELRLDMPEEIRSRTNVTFEWIGFNWNPHGHIPPGIYDLPHFDMHFYTVSRDAIDGIRLGPCEGFINCDDRERALKPVPARFVPKDYIDVAAVVGQMGNHLLDPTSPELRNPPEKFTHTFIHGANDGSIIFFEPMITHAFLLERPDMCVPLKLPQAYEVRAYYPTKYCMRYLGEEGRYTVSLEGFVLR